MNRVRVKMRCVKNETAQHGEILLTPVVGGSEENERFYESTPGGSVHLNVLKPPVSAFFKEGCEYYVDFCEADDERTTNDPLAGTVVDTGAGPTAPLSPAPPVRAPDDVASRITRHEAREEAAREAEVEADRRREVDGKAKKK